MAGPAEGAHASGHDDDGTLALRLVSMGIIAVVSLCGCALPAAIHHRHYHGSSKGAASPSPTTTIFSILKCFAAGIILGVGMVHVLPDANEMMAAAAPGFPWAFAFALFGVLLNVAVNQGMEIAFRRIYGVPFDSQEQHNHDQAEARQEEGRGLLPSTTSSTNGTVRSCCPPERSGGHHPHPHHHNNQDKEDSHGPAHPDAEPSSVHLPYYSARYGSLGHAPPSASSLVYPNDPTASGVRRSGSCHEYHESLLTALAAGVEEGDAPMAGARHCYHHEETRHIVAAFQTPGRSVLTAMMVEIGIVFHSILVGVGLGVITTDRTTVLGLLVAISFHQFFEGMGLATVILEAAASLSPQRIALLFIIFSVTTPFGVGVGVLLTALSPGATASKSGLLLEGALNGVAAGVLLSLGLQDMLISELHQRKAQNSPGLQTAMWLSAVAGTVFMDVLAVWA